MSFSVNRTLTATRTATPTATPTITVTATPSATPTATRTATETFTPTVTLTDTPTVTLTASETLTSTETSTRTSTRTATPTVTSTATRTETPTGTPTVTVTDTSTETASPTSTRSPTATATPQAPLLAMSKASNPASGYENTQVEYSLVISNTGAGAAVNLTVYDTVPNGMLFQGPGALQADGYGSNDAWRATGGDAIARGPYTIPAGQSLTVLMQVLVQAGTAGQNLTNTASASEPFFGQSASASAATTILAGVATATSTGTISPTFSVSPTFTRTASPTRTITETATPSSTATPSATATRTPFPILSLGKSSDVANVSALGDTVTFVLSLQNSGSDTAQNVSVWDSLPGNAAYLAGSAGVSFAGGIVSWSPGSLAPGNQAFTFSVSFTGSGTEISNLASAQGSNHAKVDSNTVLVAVGVAYTATSTHTPSPTSTATPTATPSFTDTATPTVTATVTQTSVPPSLTLSMVRDQGDGWPGGNDLRFSITLGNGAGSPPATDLFLRFDSDPFTGNNDLDVQASSGNNLGEPSDPLSTLYWKKASVSASQGVLRGYFSLAGGQVTSRSIFTKVLNDGVGRTITSRAVLSSDAFGLAVTATVQTYIFCCAPVLGTLPTNTPTPVASLGKIISYPQPAKNNLCFAYHAPAAGAVKILVYNMAFQLVATIKDTAMGGMLENSCVDISNMAPGVYMYKASAGDFVFPMGQFGVAR